MAVLVLLFAALVPLIGGGIGLFVALSNLYEALRPDGRQDRWPQATATVLGYTHAVQSASSGRSWPRQITGWLQVKVSVGTRRTQTLLRPKALETLALAAPGGHPSPAWTEEAAALYAQAAGALFPVGTEVAVRIDPASLRRAGDLLLVSEDALVSRGDSLLSGLVGLLPNLLFFSLGVLLIWAAFSSLSF